MRIIAGEHRGRKFLSPEGLTTRPIPDRVKLALFNILGDLTDKVVLDLFCGTGSMGLESLSRWARRCYFSDMDPSAVSLLRQNIQTFKLDDRSRVWQGDVLASLATWLNELTGPVDVAFVDPPYAMTESWDWAQATRQLFEPIAARLADGGRVMLRIERTLQSPEALGPLTLHRRREYGKMALVFYMKR